MQWSAPVFWLLAVIVLGILEAATTQLVTIWFALGALVAMLAAVFHAPIWLQIGLFVAVSVLTLILTRPLVRKQLNSKKTATNADRVLGHVGIVQHDISNTKAQGTVTIDGAVWTARSADTDEIAAGTQVVAERIEGVKLIVRPVDIQEKGE